MRLRDVYVTVRVKKEGSDEWVTEKRLMVTPGKQYYNNHLGKAYKDRVKLDEAADRINDISRH